MRRDPHEFFERTSSFIKDPDDEAFISVLNQILVEAPLPYRHSCQFDPSLLPIIYIVGAPRSGTTILSQLISRYLPVGYINNIIARFWRCPSVGIRLSKILLGDKGRNSISFESSYGYTNNVAGPHEFGYFWRHWLPIDNSPSHHLDAHSLSQIDVAAFRNALQIEILREFDSPVVFKNIICGFHAKFLCNLHPRSLFVNIERDLHDTCSSILSARMARYGSYSAWWSIKPSSFIKKPDNVVDQVVLQVLDTRREFSEELKDVTCPVIHIDYRSLCENPKDVLELIVEKINELGPQPTSLLDCPPVLKISKPCPLPVHLELSLNFAEERWFSRNIQTKEHLGT